MQANTMTMSAATTTATLAGASATLAGAVWPATAGQAEWGRRVVLVIGGSLLLALSARLKIPLGAVPFTMQTFVVLVLGMVYGPRLAAATLLAYFGEGALGLPVFAGGGGLAYFTGPTAGFLLAFLPAAALLGALAERGWGRTFATTVAAMLLGTAVIFAGGLAWLGHLIGLQKALAVGFLPFIASESAKILLAALALPACWRLLRGRARGRGE